MTFHKLFASLPVDLRQAMSEAAKQGILVSFLLTLTDEVVTDMLQEQHFYSYN